MVDGSCKAWREKGHTILPRHTILHSIRSSSLVESMYTIATFEVQSTLWALQHAAIHRYAHPHLTRALPLVVVPLLVGVRGPLAPVGNLGLRRYRRSMAPNVHHQCQCMFSLYLCQSRAHIHGHK